MESRIVKEITAEREHLTIELNKLSSDAKNVQLIVTSRYVEIQNFTWARDVQSFELVPLDQEAISGYLQQCGIPDPTNERLLSLFGNPMMLTLYAGTDRIVSKYNADTRFSFFEVRTEAELLWNFNEAQLAKLLEGREGKTKD
jgi:hypothetical protein